MKYLEVLLAECESASSAWDERKKVCSGRAGCHWQSTRNSRDQGQGLLPPERDDPPHSP